MQKRFHRYHSEEPWVTKDLELCDDDEDLFIEIVQAYLEDVMQRSKHFLYALEAGDSRKVEERPHFLKGSSSNIFTGPIREAAQLFGKTGHIEDISEAPQLYKAIKKEFKCLLEHLNILPLPSS